MEVVGSSPISWLSCPFGRRSRPQAPSLRRNYPVSTVLRACPSPQAARPVPHGLPVGVHARHRLGLHVLCWVSVCRHAVAITPEGPLGRCRFTRVASPRPSDGGLPRHVGGSAPSSSLSGPAQRSLALRPACSPGRRGDPLSRRLRRFRYLCRRSDSFRLERLS